VSRVVERANARPNLLMRALWWCADRYATLTTKLIAARGLAVLRIGYGTLWVLFLLREWDERGVMWGPSAPFSPTLDRQYATQSHWPGLLRSWLTAVAGLTPTEFNLFYILAIAVGVAFALGWHTRIASILFAGVVVALENRSPMLTDGGDNVLMLMSVYLAFTACGTYWSLDARRRAAKLRKLPALPEPTPSESELEPIPTSPTWRAELAEAWRRMLTVAHNGAVLVVAVQICVIYGTAGLLKVQGSMWQDGSALAYVLQLDWFHPWPGLSTWLAGHAIFIAIAGYVTVFVQAGFPFIVWAPRLKYPALAVLVGMHASIAVLLGLPFFSAMMLVGDAIFLPDRFWAAAVRRLQGPAYAENMATLVQPTLVFDGDCGFCTASVNFLRRWCRPAIRIVPWQRLDLAAHGLTHSQVTKAVQWLPVSEAEPIRSGAAAVAHVLLRSRWPWRPIDALMLIPPISWLAEVVYRIISANRYRLPGSTPACAVPAARSDFDVESAPESAPESAQSLGDLSGSTHDSGSGSSRVELAERDHAD
jgi:predicted DCC family thiol-disulfide oxidoreductase YuxK